MTSQDSIGNPNAEQCEYREARIFRASVGKPGPGLPIAV